MTRQRLALLIKLNDATCLYGLSPIGSASATTSPSGHSNESFRGEDCVVLEVYPYDWPMHANLNKTAGHSYMR
jgi:hypothetical protein